MKNLSTQIPGKYIDPICSNENVKRYCAAKLPELERELEKVKSWVIDDPDELHHIHIRDVNIRNLQAEITLLKGLYSVAELIDFRDIAHLPDAEIDELYSAVKANK
jgi:hypothetical protein